MFIVIQPRLDKVRVAVDMSFVVTGANSGLGFEVARLLASEHGEDTDVAKVIITTRSQAKADAAIERLIEATGRPRAFFSSLLFDVNDRMASEAAIEAAPAKVQGVLLNAGGWGTNEVLDSGMIDAFSKNMLGHAILVEGLLRTNKLKKNGRVVFAGSFAAVGTAAAIPRPDVKDPSDVKEWASYMDGSGYESFDQGTCYAYTKLIGSLYMSKLAREHPDRFFCTVSPNGHSTANFAMRLIIPMSLKVMEWWGAAQSAEEGARRFGRGLAGKDFAFESGVFAGSKTGMVG